MTRFVSVAGIAGGVGTTVLATVLGGVEVEVTGADFVVARNDFRCAKALSVAAGTGKLLPTSTVVLLMESGRALEASDFEAVLGTSFRIVAIPLDLAVARADDAGILDLRPKVVRKLRDALLPQNASI